jgi:acetyl esterase/lipase
VPRGADRRDVPLVVFIHGGFWRPPYGRFSMWLIARDARRNGWASLNVSYRLTGRWGGGGGWPATFDDVAAAVEAGRTALGITTAERVAVVGHSAGGHLALWLAADGRVPLTGVISLGGVVDLRAVGGRPGGRDAVAALLPGDEPPFGLTSPIEMLPLSCRAVLVHGTDDETVSLDDARRFVDTAREHGNDVELILVEGDAHRSALSPRSGSWGQARATLAAWFPPR